MFCTLKKLILNAHKRNSQALIKYVFNILANMRMDMSANRYTAGRLFHTDRPHRASLRPPYSSWCVEPAACLIHLIVNDINQPLMKAVDTRLTGIPVKDRA
jgi:hypothetical protein